jgi:hypothetical protein
VETQEPLGTVFGAADSCMINGQPPLKHDRSPRCPCGERHTIAPLTYEPIGIILRNRSGTKFTISSGEVKQHWVLSSASDGGFQLAPDRVTDTDETTKSVKQDLDEETRLWIHEAVILRAIQPCVLAIISGSGSTIVLCLFR